MLIAKLGTDTNNSTTTLSNSFSHTLVAGTDRVIVVSIVIENTDTISVSTVTYGGVTMTLAASYLTGTSGARNLVEVWYLLEASLPTNGSNTVSATLSGTPNALVSVVLCAEYQGMYQGIPEDTDTAYETVSATVTNNIAPSTGAWVISAMGSGANDSTWTQNESQVELLDTQGAGGSQTSAFAELRGASGQTTLSSTYGGTVLREVRVAVSFAHSSTPGPVYQINVGGSAAIPYVADQFFSGGTTRSVANSITIPGSLVNPAPTAVYQSERYGNSTYTITGLTAGASYQVRLHFAELYWSAASSRLFNVSINSVQVLSNFDIYVAAGNANYTAVIEEFYTTANISGQIVIVFTTVTDNATIEGIEIIEAPMSIYVNVAGTWKTVTSVYVNVAGTWKTVQTLYLNVTGTWK